MTLIKIHVIFYRLNLLIRLYLEEVVLNSDGSFDYTHDDSENFEDKFTYLLNDGECSTWDTVTVTIRIDPVPDSHR